MVEPALHPVPAGPELDVVGAVGHAGPPRVLRLHLAGLRTGEIRRAGRCGIDRTIRVAHRMHQAGRCGAGITAVVGGTGLGSGVAHR